MKIAITGHTQGIGKRLFERLSPNDDGRYFQQLGFGWSFNTVEVVM